MLRRRCGGFSRHCRGPGWMSQGNHEFAFPTSRPGWRVYVEQSLYYTSRVGQSLGLARRWCCSFQLVAADLEAMPAPLTEASAAADAKLGE